MPHVERKSRAAKHVHCSALSENLSVSQQEFLIQFSFHGDSRE